MAAEPRSLDIDTGSEILSIGLDNLDSNPREVSDLLRDHQCSVSQWLRLASEYAKSGLERAAETLVSDATDFFQNGLDLPDQQAALRACNTVMVHLTLEKARNAPVRILADAKQDNISSADKRDTVVEAAQRLLGETMAGLGQSEGLEKETYLFLTRGIHQMAAKNFDEALLTFEGILQAKPTNMPALLAKGRLLYTRRQFRDSLRTFQQALQLNPAFIPDPRIGIGLCLWSLGQHDRAKAAWQRSIDVNPTLWPAHALLGLTLLNTSKNMALSEEDRARAYAVGTRHIERSFKANNRNASSAIALSDFFLRKGDQKRCLKLVERGMQYADTRTVLTEAQIKRGRLAHAEGRFSDALQAFGDALELQPGNVLASLCLAQTRLQKFETAGAIHALEEIMKPPNAHPSLEAMVMLSSIRSHQRPGISSSEYKKDRELAREMLDRALRIIESPGTEIYAGSVKDDVELQLEIADLWQNEPHGIIRVEKALADALQISNMKKRADSRLTNNLGVLRYISGHFDQAQGLFERSLSDLGSSDLSSPDKESFSTSILYNLARTYEAAGEEARAKEAYEKLLSRHPEYVDAKVRLASMHIDLGRTVEAHELIKQALQSHTSNLNLRAFYSWFLYNHNANKKPAKDFVVATLKDIDKSDVYSLCAGGWITYYQARENKDNTPSGHKERQRGFQRAAEFFEKALQLDESNAFAAQALAIMTAEDLMAVPGVKAVDDPRARQSTAREGLDIFAKVRESLDDGSVYVNIGHCYFNRDELDRAIESYETASSRYYRNRNSEVLLYLCRTWFTKATKESSFSAMQTALRYAQRVMHAHPGDKSVLYNIALMQQKAVELLFSVAPAKRTLVDLRRAIEQAHGAQRIFEILGSDVSSTLPYDRTTAEQRRRYGDSLLRKSEMQLATQEEHENEVQSKVESARQRRQEEKDRMESAERQRLEEIRLQNERLAEERRKAREEAAQWSAQMRAESDEERDRKVKRAANRKPRADKTDSAAVSGDEDDQSKEPPKKRGRPSKAPKSQEIEDAPLFSDEDVGGDKIKKRVSKKRTIRDDDEEETAAVPSNPRKKQIKSKDYISDSDEDMG